MAATKAANPACWCASESHCPIHCWFHACDRDKPCIHNRTCDACGELARDGRRVLCWRDEYGEETERLDLCASCSEQIRAAVRVVRATREGRS